VTLPDVSNFISQTGFPIFVAVVLLWRVDTMHAANLAAIHALTVEIRLLRVALTRDLHENAHGEK
jgi:hypothetical protein